MTDSDSVSEHGSRSDLDPSPHLGDAGESTAMRADDPPRTGNVAVDRALASVAELDPADLSGHHDRLATTHEALHRALDPDAQDRPEADAGEPR